MTSAPLAPETRERFDHTLEAILDALPENVSGLLEETPLIVEDEPTLDHLQSVGIRDQAELRELSDLCGLHSGIPLSDRSVFESELVPSQIHLFRGPIFRLAGEAPGELEKQIRITLLHELGHHFGLTEEDLEDLGYG